MVDLPAPIIPTSTIERWPKAAVTSASWVALAAFGKMASDIFPINDGGWCPASDIRVAFAAGSFTNVRTKEH
jgi:hypothetical protein